MTKNTEINVKGEIIFYSVNLFFPHNADYNRYGNFFMPVYLTKEEAIRNHPNRSIIKIHQTKDSKLTVEIVYTGK